MKHNELNNIMLVGYRKDNIYSKNLPYVANPSYLVFNEKERTSLAMA